jgi:hypothetical protein
MGQDERSSAASSCTEPIFQYIRNLVRFWVLPIYVSAIALISWGSWRYRQAGDLGILAFKCSVFDFFTNISVEINNVKHCSDIPFNKAAQKLAINWKSSMPGAKCNRFN